jgi:hypothetical protein
MFTTEAVAKHGHENSPPRAASPVNNGSFLLQMPLSILGSVLRGQTPSPSQATLDSNHARPTTDAPSTSTPPPKDVMKIQHDEPIVPFTPSRPTSSSSNATDEKLKKRAPRSKTSYNLARPVHPRSKLHIRPKILLQLHQVIASQRPKPAYEVIPFSLLPQRSTRRFSRSFNTKERLGPHDLLIVKAEAYNTKDEEERSDEERWGSRDVIGVIRPGKSEKGVAGPTEICLDDGFSRWEVTDMPSGGYEFNSTDEHGLTLKARWVAKSAYARRVSSMSTATPLSPTFAPEPEDKKFTFSTISATTRRHPIIATMTRTRIDIMDSYTMPPATSPPTPSTHTQSPTVTPSTVDLNSFIDNLADKLPIETDDALRRFILASGIWVATKEFAPETSNPSSTPALTPCATFRPPTHRTVSMSVIDAPRSPSPASTLDEHRRSFPRMFKPSMERLPRRTSLKSLTDAPPSPASTKTTVAASPVVKTRGRRANSTGTALHSMTGSMRRQYGLAFEDQTLVETAEERQLKRSVELRRIKELTLPSPVERPSVETARSPPAAIPSPCVISASLDGPTSPVPLLASPLLSPPLADSERSRKTQSAYAPITTTGLWDSGVTEGSGLKKRPTSMFVMNEKKRKQEKKSERGKTKDSKTKGSEDSAETLGLRRKGDWYVYKIKLRLKEIFKKEKA